MNVYVTSGKVETDPNKTIIGFGSLKPYEDKIPNAREALYKINQIDTFLKAVDADKIPLTIRGQNPNGEDVFMKADAYYQTGIAKDGTAYGFNKIAIELQPEKRNEAGELIQASEKLYATKGKGGYAFDKNCDPELIAKFNKSLESGADFTLSATKNETLSKYPKLMEAVGRIQKSANFELDFEKGKGAYIVSVVSPVEKSATGQEISGTKQMLDLAAGKKTTDLER